MSSTNTQRDRELATLKDTQREHGARLNDLHEAVRELMEVTRVNNDRTANTMKELATSVNTGLTNLATRLSDVEIKSVERVGSLTKTNWPVIFGGGMFVLALLVALIASKVDPVSSTVKSYSEGQDKAERMRDSYTVRIDAHQDDQIKENKELAMRAFETAIRADERARMNSVSRSAN